MVLVEKHRRSRESDDMFDDKHVCCLFAAHAQFVCLCAGGENTTDVAERATVGFGFEQTRAIAARESRPRLAKWTVLGKLSGSNLHFRF